MEDMVRVAPMAFVASPTNALLLVATVVEVADLAAKEVDFRPSVAAVERPSCV